ncbi:hypothetical protein IVB04_00505 [Bradyrhizobium sp. 169]|nr:hypothetical protein [Bradyrhizobium sp. 169]
MTATALISAIGDRSVSRTAASSRLGLFWCRSSDPAQVGPLFGIGKRGDRDLRTLMIHGARAALSGLLASRIREASGLARCGNLPTLRSLLLPTRMRGSCGLCSRTTSLSAHTVGEDHLKRNGE